MTITPNLPIASTCAPWAVPSDIKETDPTTLDQPVIQDMLQAASDVLFRLSGEQFAGSCADTVRPSARSLVMDHGRPIRAGYPYGGGFAGSGYYGPGYAGADFSQWGWCTCNQREDPGGNMVPQLSLGVFPLTGITEILVNGQVLDPSTYRIDDNRWLTRLAPPSTDGVTANTDNPGWPCCQRTDLTPDQPDTWQVKLTYGMPPPALGVYACTELAYQLYLSLGLGTGACRLPGRITAVVRNGVSAIVADPMTFLSQGKTGLTICDYFLESFNAGGLRRRSTFWNPDMKRRVMRSGPVG